MVEAAIQTFPGVAGVAVVAERLPGQPEDEIKAWIVAAAGVDLDVRTLLEHCVAHLPHFMVPRFFEVTSEFPKTPTTKVRKHLLRERGSGPDTWDRRAKGWDVTRRGLEQVAPSA